MLNDTDPQFNQALSKKKQISDLVDVNQSDMGVVVIEKALISDLGPTKETSSDEEVSFVQQRAESCGEVQYESPTNKS